MMAEGTKKLYRSNDDRWIAGVCGGIAEYFNLDPTLIRVLFILFGLIVGGGLIIYLILWLVIPQAPADAVQEPVEEPAE
jgi:phage shock protein C